MFVHGLDHDVTTFYIKREGVLKNQFGLHVATALGVFFGQHVDIYGSLGGVVQLLAIRRLVLRV